MLFFLFAVRQRYNNSIRLSEINNHSTKTLQQVLYVRDNKLKTESMFVECFESPVVGASSTLNFAWEICSPTSSQHCKNIATGPMAAAAATATTSTTRTNVSHCESSNSYTTLNPLIFYDNNEENNDVGSDDVDDDDDKNHIKTTNV